MRQNYTSAFKRNVNTNPHHFGSTYCLVILIIFAIFLCQTGCNDQADYIGDPTVITGDSSSTDQSSEMANKADRWRQVMPSLGDEEVVVARIQLGEVRGEGIEVKEQFLGHFEAIEEDQDAEIEGELREGLKGTFTARKLTAQGESGVLRTDRYVANGDIEAKKLLEGLTGSMKNSALLPFKMTAGAEVTFTRLFEDQETADQAPLLTPFNLPFNRQNALALPEGTVVQVPVEAQMSLNLNGQHLSRSWSQVTEFAELLKSSATGYTSAAIQGLLMVKGSFIVTLTRHHQNMVRIQVQRSQQGRGGFGVEGGLKVTFFPTAAADRLRSFASKLKKWGKIPSKHLQGWAERLRNLRRSISSILRPLLDHSNPESYPEEIRKTLEFAESNIDPVLELLEQSDEAVDQATAWIEEKIDSTLTGRQMVDELDLLDFDQQRKRAFNLKLAAQLSADSIDHLGILGDYMIDLSSEAGQAAFETMLSGRAEWDGILNHLTTDLGLIDLSLVDGLVSDEVDGVRCLRRAELKSNQKRVNISIKSPFSSWHLATQRQTHSLDVIVDGREELWEASQWSNHSGLNAFNLDFNETLLSGQLAQIRNDEDEVDEIDQGDGADGEEWAYWMSWSKQWSEDADAPVTEAFSEAINLSGSIGLHHGLPQHFFTEAGGALKAQLTLVFYDGFLHELMDSVDTDLIWAAAAQTAMHFDHHNGLPYAPAFRTPELTENAAASCEIITKMWGKRYCRIIHYDLIKPLLEIRDSADSAIEKKQAQRSWLAKLYERHFLFTPIGARVTARLFCELAKLMGREDEVSLRFRLDHPSAPEVGLDLSLDSVPTLAEDQPIHALEIAEWLGLSEGISFWP